MTRTLQRILTDQHRQERVEAMYREGMSAAEIAETLRIPFSRAVADVQEVRGKLKAERAAVLASYGG